MGKPKMLVLGNDVAGLKITYVKRTNELNFTVFFGDLIAKPVDPIPLHCFLESLGIDGLAIQTAGDRK